MLKQSRLLLSLGALLFCDVSAHAGPCDGIDLRNPSNYSFFVSYQIRDRAYEKVVAQRVHKDLDEGLDELRKTFLETFESYHNENHGHIVVGPVNAGKPDAQGLAQFYVWVSDSRNDGLRASRSSAVNQEVKAKLQSLVDSGALTNFIENPNLDNQVNFTGGGCR